MYIYNIAYVCVCMAEIYLTKLLTMNKFGFDKKISLCECPALRYVYVLGFPSQAGD